jgi:aryl-alcohol dehydrogenase-like predicted oxidoreductase
MQVRQTKTIQPGQSGVELTRMGFGAWAIGGGGGKFGWRPQGKRESIETIRRAPELGVNRIDAATGDGFGHSEEPAAS